MTHNPNASDPASDQIGKLAADLGGAVPERSELNLELLIALTASVERNERVQEKFRNAVGRSLAHLAHLWRIY
jgi:hypothetical protein